MQNSRKKSWKVSENIWQILSSNFKPFAECFSYKPLRSLHRFVLTRPQPPPPGVNMPGKPFCASWSAVLICNFRIGGRNSRFIFFRIQRSTKKYLKITVSKYHTFLHYLHLSSTSKNFQTNKDLKSPTLPRCCWYHGFSGGNINMGISQFLQFSRPQSCTWIDHWSHEKCQSQCKAGPGRHGQEARGPFEWMQILFKCC